MPVEALYALRQGESPSPLFREIYYKRALSACGQLKASYTVFTRRETMGRTMDKTKLKLALAAGGFGLFFAYSRLLSLGFDGLLDFGTIASADAFYLVRSGARILTFVALMILGYTGRFVLGRRSILGAGAVMAATTALFTVGAGGPVGVVVTVLAGMSNAVLMFAWSVALCSRAPREIVGVSLAALLVGGAVLMGAPLLAPVTCLVFLTAVALASGVALVAFDPTLAAFKADERVTRQQLAAFPWFSVIAIVACGVMGTVFYGVASQLFWNVGDPANYSVLGLAVSAVIAATALLILRHKAWAQLVWVPVFVLLVAGLFFACILSEDVRGTSIALMLSSVFCYHFLRWMVFPSLVAQTKTPPMLMCGAILIITNNFLSTRFGEGLAGAIPASLHNIGSLACLFCIALTVLFAAGMLNYRRLPAPSVRAFEDVFAEASERYRLTAREREIALLTAKGRSATYIADTLVISSSTVRFHQQNAYRKLNVSSKQELIDFVDALAK